MKQIQVELQNFMGNDRLISEAAWTSSMEYQKKQTRTDEDVKRVVEMLATQKHSTPFESVVLRFWIKMPIAIDRQFMTHRLQSASGMSGRYRTMPSEFLELPEDVLEIYRKIYVDEATLVDARYTRLCREANEFYTNECKAMKAAVKDGFITNDEYKRVRESLRGVLPQHNMTERVTTINLRSLANFFKLRLSSHAQPEIQYVAQLMLAELKKNNVAPVAIEFLEKIKWDL
jgi:thymidylate synthase (FAD)